VNVKPAEVLAACRDKHVMLASAESCTGGMIGAILTDVAGSSDVFERGFVTYSNEAKHDMLGVPTSLIDEVGAVSEEVARAMAEGVIRHSNAQISVSVTGVAGPGGGSESKPVGLVHIAVAYEGHDTHHERHMFVGDRKEVRMQAVTAAFNLIMQCLEH
jgi:nicotinamide-nucleotide amidase